MTLPSVTVYDSLGTVPVKQRHCRCCDPWLVRHITCLLYQRKHFTGWVVGAHGSGKLFQKPTVAGRKYTIQRLNFCGCWDPNWRVYEEIDSWGTGIQLWTLSLWEAESSIVFIWSLLCFAPSKFGRKYWTLYICLQFHNCFKSSYRQR